VFRRHPSVRYCAALLAFIAWGAVPALADDAATLRGHELTAMNGDSVRLDDFRGRVVVVNFWASWCKPCLRELPEFDRWNAELTDDEVVFAAISVDQRKRLAERFAQKAGLSLPIYHDGADGLARSLDLPALPCTYVLDANGDIAAINEGGSAEDLRALRAVIERLRSGLEANATSQEARR